MFSPNSCIQLITSQCSQLQPALSDKFFASTCSTCAKFLSGLSAFPCAWIVEMTSWMRTSDQIRSTSVAAIVNPLDSCCHLGIVICDRTKMHVQICFCTSEE